MSMWILSREGLSLDPEKDAELRAWAAVWGGQGQSQVHLNLCPIPTQLALLGAMVLPASSSAHARTMGLVSPPRVLATVALASTVKLASTVSGTVP